MTLVLLGNDRKLMLSKGDRPGLWTPAAISHPYAGAASAELRHWLVGESVYPSFTTFSTDGSTQVTTRAVNIGSPASGEYLLLIHRAASTTTAALPGGWGTDWENTTNSNDRILVSTRLCDGTEGATVNVTHGTAARSISQVFKFAGSGAPVYSYYTRNIPLVGSVSPFTDPLDGGVQPGVRNLFIVVCTWEGGGEQITDVPSGYINGGDVVNTGSSGAGLAHIIYGYKYAVSNVEESATFPMPDTIAGGVFSLNFGIVVPPA
jgi:hypothetical protein